MLFSKMMSKAFDSAEFYQYISSLPSDYFHETIHCDGMVNPKVHSTLRQYKSAVEKYCFEHMDFELEQELYFEAMGKKIDRSECVILMNQLFRSEKFNSHLSLEYEL